MHHASSHRVKGTTRRSPRPSISPYLMEEIGLTFTNIRRAQVAEFDSSLRRELRARWNHPQFAPRG